MGNRAFAFLILLAAVCCLCTESAASDVSKSNCRLHERKICATSTVHLTCCRKDPAHKSSKDNYICPQLESDASHCGSCTKACSHGQICRKGKCVTTTPPPSIVPCRKLCIQGLSCCNDTCVDLQSDDENCGACGTSCRPLPGFAGFLFCFQGKCVP